MYILFNREGNIITSIPHGQIVRQNNDFDLHICFPHEHAFRNLNPFVEFSVDGAFKLAGVIDTSHWGDTFTFKKLDRNEAEFEFKEGYQYYRYHIIVPASSGVTSVYGYVPFVVSVVLNKVVRQARANLTISKTYGSDGQDGMESSNMDTVLTMFKKTTNLYTFDGEAMNSCTIRDTYIYSWKTLAFVRGFVSLPTAVSELPDFEGYEGYAAVAKFEDCVDLLVESVFLGHTMQGDDVELRVVGDGNDADYSGTIYLLVNKESDLSANEEFWFIGQFMATQATLELTDPETTPESVIIKDVLATAVASETATVSRRLVRAGDENIDEYKLYFDFGLPKGDKGDSGQDGQNGQDGAAASIAVGTTTTVASGVDASVTNVGTSSAAVLNFAIPKGADAVLHETSGFIGFKVNEDGQLVAVSTDGEEPNLSIDDDGRLIYTY